MKRPSFLAIALIVSISLNFALIAVVCNHQERAAALSLATPQVRVAGFPSGMPQDPKVREIIESVKEKFSRTVPDSRQPSGVIWE